MSVKTQARLLRPADPLSYLLYLRLHYDKTNFYITFQMLPDYNIQ